ncbi:MAG: putative DNA binding domain-containing protein [Clostridiales Family XIII bacterium]|jgi:ATP-dependent DNA helicase RecG|nr:putative DNA binding domain-containing protein [Clostridiales Family XIII bacterium]
MNVDELEKVLESLRMEESDNRQYEVKMAAGGFPQTVLKSICAFANMPGGGTIILGVDERQDFAVTGVYDAKNCQQTMANHAQRDYTLPIVIDISLVVVGDRNVVIGDVHEIENGLKPVKYRKTGSSFIRQYDSDFELSSLEERLFEINQGIVNYDGSPVPNSSVADLSKPLVDGYIISRKRHSDILASISDDEVLLRTGILHHTGELSVAGLLALGVYPQQFFPNYTIKASIRGSSDTSSRTRAVNVRAFDGPVPTMLEGALRWIQSGSREYTMDLEDGNVASVCEYPAVTCREMLANALVHRALNPIAMIETITLILDDNRLVLSNPGGLFGLTVGELGRTASRTRNSRLAEICQYVPAERGANVIEKLGSGIPKMFAEQQRYGFKPPQFIDGEIYFTAILRKGQYGKSQRLGVRMANTERIIIALSGATLSRSEIEKKTMLTTGQVRYALSKLVEERRVIKTGNSNDPNVAYKLVDEN